MTVTQFEQDLVARLAELDARRTHAQQEVDDCATRAEVLARRLEVMRSASATLASLPSLAREQEWRDFLTKSRDTLSAELLALPPRIRTDHELGTRRNLQLSIIAIDQGPGVADGTGYALETLRLGQLMREAGYVAAPAVAGAAFDKLPWYGALPQVEHRINELTKRRDEAQTRLDEALLDDAERERREAEDTARCAARNAAPQRKTRPDGSQFDRYPDGRRVEVEGTV